MLAVLRNSSTSIILFLAICFSNDRADAAEKKAAVSGTPMANLRAGAGVEHALKLTLKEGAQVTVEKIEGEWFLVAAADGQKGYIHKNFLKLADETPAQATPMQPPTQKSTASEAKEAGKETAPAAGGAQGPAAPPLAASEPLKPAAAPSKMMPPAPPPAPEAKSQSILQMIEGHEAEVKIAALVAALAFVLGWFCGGTYYLRRERKARRKLRF